MVSNHSLQQVAIANAKSGEAGGVGLVNNNLP